MILAINTAQVQHEMALLRENPASPGEWELISEKIWLDTRNAVEELPAFLKKLLEETGTQKEEIKQIIVVRGPGSFTALRTGVAFANALAEGLHAKLYAIDTFELLRRKAALADPILVILHAGRMDAGVQFQDEEIKVGMLAPLLKDYPHGSGICVVAQLNETLQEELHSLILEKKWRVVEGHELQTLGEMLMTHGVEQLEEKNTVEPLYLKGPHITHSSDPWKQ
jgi:tRNA threonylcarbamoyl adenosine modification protein YeaZ